MKSLLKENEVRKTMRLAGLSGLTDTHIAKQKLYEATFGDDDEDAMSEDETLSSEAPLPDEDSPEELAPELEDAPPVGEPPVDSGSSMDLDLPTDDLGMEGEGDLDGEPVMDPAFGELNPEDRARITQTLLQSVVDAVNQVVGGEAEVVLDDSETSTPMEEEVPESEVPEVEGEPVADSGLETTDETPVDDVPMEEEEDDTYEKVMEAVFKKVAQKIKIQVTKENMDSMVQKLSERIMNDLRGKRKKV